MRGYILSPLADTDLDKILVYVATESGTAAADRLELEFHEVMERISLAPGIGHLRTDLTRVPLRFASLHKFMIAYLPETRPVEIARIFHGARDIGAILGDGPTE